MENKQVRDEITRRCGSRSRLKFFVICSPFFSIFFGKPLRNSKDV